MRYVPPWQSGADQVNETNVSLSGFRAGWRVSGVTGASRGQFMKKVEIEPMVNPLGMSHNDGPISDRETQTK